MLDNLKEEIHFSSLDSLSLSLSLFLSVMLSLSLCSRIVNLSKRDGENFDREQNTRRAEWVLLGRDRIPFPRFPQPWDGGEGRIWSNRAGDTSERKILITSGDGDLCPDWPGPGHTWPWFQRNKTNASSSGRVRGPVSQSGRGCNTPPRSKRDPRRARWNAANVIKPRVDSRGGLETCETPLRRTGWNRVSCSTPFHHSLLPLALLYTR